MKRIILILLLATLSVGCKQNAVSQGNVSQADETRAPDVQVEVLSEPYMEPFSYEPMHDTDEIFSRMRIQFHLPAQAEQVELAIVTSQNNYTCAQAVFTVNGMPCYYRVAYTVDAHNLSDDNTTYEENKTVPFKDHCSYLLNLNTASGRVLWYDSYQGTSNSLYVPYAMDAELLETLTQELMEAQGL